MTRWAGALAVTLFFVMPLAAFTGQEGDVRPVAPGPGVTSGHAGSPSSFSTNLRVTDNSRGYDWQVEPSLAVDSNGVLYLGWKEADTHNGSGRRVGFSRSLDNGASWSPGILMDRPFLKDGTDPWLVVDKDDTAYFARLDYTSTGPSSVIVSKSMDAGASWGPIVTLSEVSSYVDKEAIYVDDQGTLYCAYRWGNGTTSQVQGKFTDSSDGGQTWRSPGTNLQDGLGYNLVRTPAGVIVLTHHNYLDDIVVERSTDGGRTFTAPVPVNDVPGAAHRPFGKRFAMPWIAVDTAGAVYVAWPDDRAGDLDIYVDRSLDGGVTWGTDVLVNDVPTGDQWMPTLVVDADGVLHMIWEDARAGDFDVYYASSSDGGQSWSPDLLITTARSPAVWDRPGDYLALAAGPDGTIHAAWTDGRDGDWNIYSANKPPPLRPRAPENLNATLQGGALQDVVITWDLSPDDATLVDHYEVRYEMAYDPAAAGYVPLGGCGTVPAGQASCVHAGAGDGDPASYYYAVTAVGASGVGETSVTQAAKFTRLLGDPAGRRFELLSVPVLTATDPSTVVATYPPATVLRTYVAADATDPWKAATTFKGPGTDEITAIGPSMGLWVEALSPDLWTVAGRVITSWTIPLNAGWNLVGYPSSLTRTVAAAMPGLWGAPVTRIEGHSVEAPYHLQTSQGWDILSPGHAYWVYATSDALWTLQD